MVMNLLLGLQAMQTRMTLLKGWEVLTVDGGSVVDAVVQGCQEAELDLSATSVGYGNHPDESNEVTLDAMVFDG